MADNTNNTGHRCSFCGKPEGKAGKLIAGREAFICDECVELCAQMLGLDFDVDDDIADEGAPLDIQMHTPHEIKSYLDDYIIGQDRAKIALSVAV